MAQGNRGYGVPNWISIAGKVGFGSSLMLSEQISDDENVSPNYLSPAFSIGGRLGVVFKDRVGVSVEYLSSNTQNKYEIVKPLNTSEKSKTNLKIKSGDLLLLARYTGEYGFYAEIGPKFTSVKSVDYEIEYGNTYDLKNCFNSSFSSIVFGFGYAVVNADRVQVTLGARAAYCSKNIVKQVDGLQNTGFGKYMQMEMKPLCAQVMVDINYHFARFGKATCGAGRVIFFK